MEVFISNLQSKATAEQLQEQLKPLLKQAGIDIYDVHKPANKPYGFLTVADYSKAHHFLTSMQTGHDLSLLSTLGRQVRFQQSKKPPNAQLLRVLYKEQKDPKTNNAAQRIGKAKNKNSQDHTTKDHSLLVCKIECGHWQADGNRKDFMPYYTLSS